MAANDSCMGSPSSLDGPIVVIPAFLRFADALASVQTTRAVAFGIGGVLLAPLA